MKHVIRITTEDSGLSTRILRDVAGIYRLRDTKREAYEDDRIEYAQEHLRGEGTPSPLTDPAGTLPMVRESGS